MTAVLDAGTDLNEQARRAYRESAAAGAPLSRQALGDLFERSPSWGRDRIAEVRAEDDTTATTAIPEAAEQVPQAPTEGPPVAPVPDLAPPAVAVAAAVTVTRDTGTDTPAESHPGARLMAWAGFAIGSLVSVAGNWLAAWLPAADNPPGWAPSLASQVGAAVWPVALLVSVEVLSRTAWRAGWHWTLVRFGGVAVVALGSAVISYGHIHAVLRSWGYDPVGAGVGPLVIDGLMVVSGFALLAMSNTNREA